jgi:hypothetical protein
LYFDKGNKRDYGGRLMTFDINKVSQDKTKNIYPTGFPRVDDLLYDIALGICCNQQLSIDNNTTLKDKSKKLQKLKPKTDLHNTINNIIEELGVRKLYEWQHEMEFTSSDGELVKVIKYDITTGDMCLVKADGNVMRISKRGLREWYEN